MPEITLYKTLTVIERMDIDEHGRFIRQVEVRAITKSGVEFTVAVPKAEFKRGEVEKLLTKEAEEIESVLALKK